MTGEEWEFVLPYPLLCGENSLRRECELRAVFNGARYITQTGSPWRWTPSDLPPGMRCTSSCGAGRRSSASSYQFKNLRSFWRESVGRKGQPAAVSIWFGRKRLSLARYLRRFYAVRARQGSSPLAHPPDHERIALAQASGVSKNLHSPSFALIYVKFHFLR